MGLEFCQYIQNYTEESWVSKILRVIIEKSALATYVQYEECVHSKNATAVHRGDLQGTNHWLAGVARKEGRRAQDRQ